MEFELDSKLRAYIARTCRGLEKIKPEAHRPQCSPECTAMKAIWLLRKIFFFFFFFFENLAFRLPWPPVKIIDLDKIHMVGRGLLYKYFSKTFVKISAVTHRKMPISILPIISIWKI